jgi:hypothetical protein
MSAGGKISSCDHRGKTIKPSPRSLLKAIKRATKMTNHALRDRIPRWWTHVNILTQLTFKKCILHVKLRDGLAPNRSHHKKSVNSGHMSNRSKSLIIISTMLLLKTTSSKTSLIRSREPSKRVLTLYTHLQVIGRTHGGHGIRSHVPVCSRAAISSAITCYHSE